MKRFICILLSVCLLASLSGCKMPFGLFSSEDSSSTATEAGSDNVNSSYYSGVYSDSLPPQNAGVDSESYQESLKDVTKEKPINSPYQKVEQGNGYSSLKDGIQKEVYDKLEESIYKISSDKNESGYYPAKKVVMKGEIIEEHIIRKIIGAFNDDHPFEFWKANTFGYSYSEKDTTIQLYSALSPDDCNGAINQLLPRINTVLSNIPSNLTEYEREMYIHNWLVDNCKYDNDAIYSKNKWAAFNVYGAIVVGEAVCEGYSKSMQLLLNNVGIYCRLISGDAKNSAHMWNLVYINNRWYHLDATWNDSENVKRYDYFNVTDDVIKVDHKIYPDFDTFSKEEICGNDVKSAARYNVDVPKCNSEVANYYKVEAIKINSLSKESDKEIINELYKRVSVGEKNVSFQLSDSLDYENTIAKLFTQSPYKFLFYVDSVNELLKDKKIEKSKIVYFKVESQNAVTVEFSFV